MSASRFKGFIKNHVKHIVLLSVFAASVIVHVLTRSSHTFSDLLNFGLSAHIRALLSVANSVFPFSLSEIILVLLPLVLVATPIYSIIKKDSASKVLLVLVSILVALYALFVLAFAPAYGATPAAKLFKLTDKSAELSELTEAAYVLVDEINAISDEITFEDDSFSDMGYGLDTLGDKLIESYDILHTKYPFIKNFHSRLKPILLSKPLTYTHISGVYAYYTGESNINTNFPDYTIPFTSAHEMAHARGFARENEANFVAFLVCENTNDPYVRYSGKLSMLEYISNAIYTDDPELSSKILLSLDKRVLGDIIAYSEFFEEYRDSEASEVASAVNDTVLKSQGVAEGEKSYGLVIDLAVAYILEK